MDVVDDASLFLEGALDWLAVLRRLPRADREVPRWLAEGSCDGESCRRRPHR